jgi:hypothetical protein
MTAPEPLPHDPPPDDPAGSAHAGHAAWARGVIERHVAVEEQLAAAGLRLALAIEQAATQAAAENRPVDKDAGMAFSRVARAVRMGGLLQAKLIRELDEARARDLERAAQAREAAEAQAEDAELCEPLYRHKARVEKIVDRIATAQHGEADARDRLVAEAGERLDDEDLYGDILARPIGELVSMLCRDLGLKPDWTRLAEEAWAREEIAGGHPSSPFTSMHTPRAPPCAAAHGGEDPQAERSEERVGVSESDFHPPSNRRPERPLSWSG